jgi:hypothetical protein
MTDGHNELGWRSAREDNRKVDLRQQRQEGQDHREVEPAGWEGNPLKGETPRALPV